MPFCDTCGEWYSASKSYPHVCPPIWFACWPDREGDDGHTPIRAWSAETAAEKFAEQYDARGDYTIIGGDKARVKVWQDGGHVTWFKIAGEAVPEYTAEVIRAENADGGGDG